MTRLLTGTALGLLMGLTPALAQSDMPADEAQTPPALEQPAMPSDVAPVDPGEPAKPIPDESAETQTAPDSASGIPDKSAKMPAMPDSSSGMSSSDVPDSSAEAQPVPDGTSEIPSDSAETLPEAAPDSAVTEAPKSIMPEDQDALESESASIDGPKFLNKQEPGDLLATNLIGQPVLNAENEAIGDINDLVTDEEGKVVAVLIGAGGFLGLGEKDVAVRYGDLQFTRDENQNIKVVADMSSETLSSAPDFQRLNEQAVTVGSAGEPTTGEEKTY